MESANVDVNVQIKKLTLNKETLKNLSESELREIDGQSVGSTVASAVVVAVSHEFPGWFCRIAVSATTVSAAICPF